MIAGMNQDKSTFYSHLLMYASKYSLGLTLLEEFLSVVVLDVSRCLLPRATKTSLEIACIGDVGFVEAWFDDRHADVEFTTLSTTNTITDAQ